MSQDIQAPQSASADTQEVLKELVSEGHKVDGLTPPDPAPKAPEKPEAKPEVKPDATPKEQKDQTPPPKVQREEKFVPVGKFNDERHKRQDAEKAAADAKKLADEREAEIQRLTKQPVKTDDDLENIRDTAKQMAEEAGYDAEFMTRFAETIVAAARKGVLTPKDIEDRLAGVEAMRKQQEQQALDLAQEAGYNKEYDDVLKEFPDLNNPVAKEELKQQAFSAINTPLRTLAIQYLHDNPPGRRTAEAPLSGKKDSGEDVIDFENITEEQLAKLEGKQLDMYYDWLDKTKLKAKR